MSRKQKSTALAVVKKTEVLKISTSPRAEREQRGQSLAKDFVKFIGDMVPRIIQTRQDFLDREPDETICGVTTFRDYCTGVLDYSHSHIRNLIAGQTPASEKYSSKKPTQVTADEFANYEKTPEGEKICSTAINLLKKMEPADVVGALTGKMFGFPKPMAEAAVQIITGQSLATKEEPAKEEPATVADVVEAVTAFMDIQVRRLSEDDAEKAYEQLKQEITNRLSIAMLA